MRDSTQITSALAFVDTLMQQSDRIVMNAADEHLQAFIMQMRDKVGVDEIALNEPYLPAKLARYESQYLGRLDNVKRAIVLAKSKHISAAEKKALDSDSEFMQQVQSLADSETNHFKIEMKQDLDSNRQQAFGLTRYLWVGGDCPLCAPYNGQIFSWGGGEEPGSVHPNCNCSAEPVLENAGDAKPSETRKPMVSESGKDVIIHHPNGSVEKRVGGFRPWRNNNPGSIRSGKFADRHGAIGAAGGFAVFPDEKTGQTAQESLLKGPSYSNLTIDKAIERRSPPHENDTPHIQKLVHQFTGFTGKEKISELTDEQVHNLAMAIRRTEGWREGTVTIEPSP